MKKLLLSLAIIASMTPLSIFAQNHQFSCGTTTADLEQITNRLLQNREEFKNVVEMRGAVAYIPVAFHLIAASDGSGRVAEGRLLDMITTWNKFYADNGLEMQFYIKYLNYKNDDAIYNSPANTSGANKAFAIKKFDALNIYITNLAETTGGASGGTTLAYYTSGGPAYDNDWIVCRISEVSTSKATTIAHEVGHFFTMPHTFSGWECAPFNPSASDSPLAPTLVSCGGSVFNVENVARTGSDANCTTAGDKFCDTPADYNFGFITNGCVYRGIAKDPKGVAVDPDETNVMSYFLGCSTFLSGEQKAAMMKDYNNNSYRAYLRAGNQIPNQNLPGTTTLQLPANAARIGIVNTVNFDWADVPNATGYVIEVSTAAGFSINFRSFLSTTSDFTLNEAVAGTSGNYLRTEPVYYWKVRAFGPYKTGTAYSATNTFELKTTSVNEIPGINNFTIAPNPIEKDKKITLNLTTENAFEANVKIITLTGQVLKNEKRTFDLGYSSQLLDLSNINAGLYILSIESDKGVLNKKVTISE